MECLSSSRFRFDLKQESVRDLNEFLHGLAAGDDSSAPCVEVLNPDGQHNIAVGMQVPAQIEILGHAGYFIGGMNSLADIRIYGNVGWSLAENIMSGSVRITGCASECAAASGRGGLVAIAGDASSRCGISLKGADVVVGGNVGHMSAFMAQAGRLVICGDAGANLGDSLYEAVIYVRGKVHSLGTDAREEPMEEGDYRAVEELLQGANFEFSPQEFRRIGSARQLYHWHADAAHHY
ncbi:MAG: hypothetical protein KDA68_04575 [Planctomycetaceae bacterium]|nr:hypothetical protein [Planctomycetaceae bacterium]